MFNYESIILTTLSIYRQKTLKKIKEKEKKYFDTHETAIFRNFKLSKKFILLHLYMNLRLLVSEGITIGFKPRTHSHSLQYPIFVFFFFVATLHFSDYFKSWHFQENGGKE